MSMIAMYIMGMFSLPCQTSLLLSSGHTPVRLQWLRDHHLELLGYLKLKTERAARKKKKREKTTEKKEKEKEEPKNAENEKTEKRKQKKRKKKSWKISMKPVSRIFPGFSRMSRISRMFPQFPGFFVQPKPINSSHVQLLPPFKLFFFFPAAAPRTSRTTSTSPM